MEPTNDEGWAGSAGEPPPPPSYPGRTGPQNDPLAIASLAVGGGALMMVAFGCCCGLFEIVALMGGLAAVVLGGVSLKRMGDQPATYEGKALAITGIALGGATLLFVTLYFALAFLNVAANGALQNMHELSWPWSNGMFE